MERMSDLSGMRSIKTPDGRCLGVIGGKDGTTLAVSPCQPTAADNMQSWSFDAAPGNGYQIRAGVHNGPNQCITQLPNGEVQLMPCLNVPTQAFSLPDKFSTGNKKIVSADGKCLRIRNGPLGVNLALGACDADSNWTY